MNNSESLSFKEKQILLFKIYSILIFAVTVISVMVTAYFSVNDINDIIKSNNNISWSTELFKEFNIETFKNIGNIGLNGVSLIGNIGDIVGTVVQSLITFTLIALSTLIQCGKETRTRKILSILINLIAVAELITVSIIMSNFNILNDFTTLSSLTGMTKLFQIMSWLVIIKEIVSNGVRIVSIILILVFTFKKFKRQEKRNENSKEINNN